MDSAYPRPQLERKEWTSLNGTWKFLFDDDRKFKHPSEIKHWPLSIVVPFPPESKASGIGDTGLHCVCWYGREFELRPDERCHILHFGAVDYAARVWINGHEVIRHEGGQTPFWADITPLLNLSGHQTLAVMAEDDPSDLTKPRGKQDWKLEPHSIWYHRISGIWQTVWLEPVPASYIGKIRWTPHLVGFALDFEARIAGQQYADLRIELELWHGPHLLANDSYQVLEGETNRRIILSDPGIDDFRNEMLWSPEQPTLLDATIRLKRGSTVIDEVKSYTALRSIDIVRDRIMLNGRPYFLRLVLDQGYWPETLLAAPNDEALRRDIELTKQMGFNGVRKHQKIENPRYLYWADKLGLLVCEEMPSAYRFTRTAIKRTLREWTEAIERDYSHPCIAIWVPLNESWGVPDLGARRDQRNAVEMLYHLTKTLDPTRPVIGNDGWEASATDIIGIHDYDANLDHIRQRYGPDVMPEHLFDRRRPGGRVLTLDGYPHRGQPIILSEFGGIAYDFRRAEGVKTAWGYSVAETAEEFARRFQELMEVVATIPLFSGFCYTQFTDTFQEVNGLLCLDRTPKIPLEKMRQATQIVRSHIAIGV